MLHEPAQFEDGSVSVEAGLMAMLDRMRTGKLKVFKEHLDLVGGIPPVSPQRWKGGQRGRRFDVRHTLRADDVAPRYNAIVLGQMAARD